MTGSLAGLRAVPLEGAPAAASRSAYNPFLVLEAERLAALLWPDLAAGGPYLSDKEALTQDESATKLWARLLVVAAAGTRAGAYPWALIGFDEPRGSLGGSSIFHACRTYGGFIRSLGLVHVTGGPDPQPSSREAALLEDLEALVTVSLPQPIESEMESDVGALARRLGGHAQAVVIYACQRWPHNHSVASARGTTLYRMAKKGSRRPIRRVLDELDA